MRSLALSSCLALALTTLAIACGDDDAATPSPAADGGSRDGGDGGTSTEDAGADGGADTGSTYVEPECFLRNDTGGPGQYTDSCVQRSWIRDQAGTYKSATCTLTIDITGSVAATFRGNVSSGPNAGDFSIDWDGAPAPGNDSYYRFTTDATFATTKTLNYTAGQKVGISDERAVSLRIEGLDVGAPVYKGMAFSVVGGVNTDYDCGVMTKE